MTHSLVGFLSLACLYMLGGMSTAQGKVLQVSPQELPGVRKSYRSINEAASQAAPGDTVLIHTGVYRERVLIENSGTPDAPIRFRAAVGAQVVVTGADRITDWRREKGENPIFSTAWPYRFVAWNETFAHPGDERHRLIGRCEQVFVNQYPLHQVLHREELTRGTFFADLDEERLYVWTADNGDLSEGRHRIEASVRDQIWICRGDHVQVKGIRFRYAANRAQQGACPFEGDHNRVESCVFEGTNASGATFLGEHQFVQDCVFQNNGQLGFGANHAHHLRMVGCVVRNNNTKDFSRGWEAGGNKIVFTRGAVIEQCTFRENHGNGIWFDIGNEDNEVRNCLIAYNDDAGIFYEISYGLHAHDNVIVGNGFAESAGAWGAASGISISSSPGCVIERNLVVGNKEGFNFREQTRSTPRIDSEGSEPVWNHNEVVRHNVLAYNRDAQTWGWFDIDDERHWPEAMQASTSESKGEPKADIAREYVDESVEAEGLVLEKLNLIFESNLYARHPGQGLFHWGVTWKRHEKYTDLDSVRRDLGLAAQSRVAEFSPRDFAALDLRLREGSPARTMDCYPRGAVPGVKLGVWTGD